MDNCTIKTVKKQPRQPVARMLEAICIGSFVSILVLLPLHAFISTWGGTSIGPLLVWKSWKELLLLGLVPLLAVYFWLRPELLKQLWGRRINQLIVAYAVLTVLWALWSPASQQAVIAGLLMNLRFFAIFLLAQVITNSNHAWVGKLKSALPTWLLWTMIGLSVLAILQVFVLPHDFLSHFGYNKDTTIAPETVVDQDPSAIRAFATMRGPNTLAAYLLLPLAAAGYMIATRKQLWLAISAGALGIIALALTGSRSAWLGAVAAALVLGMYVLPQAKRLHWLRWGAVMMVIIGALTVWAAISIPALRLAVFHSRADRSSLTQGSSDQHVQATVNGIHSALAHPLGQGVGTAGPASFYNTHAAPSISENYFVQIAQEVGLPGLVLLLAIMALVVMALVRQAGMLPQVLLASFVGLTVVNMLLHGWADDPTAMTWWAMAGLFMAGKRKRPSRQP